MKKCVVVLWCLLVSVGVSAQERKFSPEKFEAELEQYITREANLDQQEAAKFFPLFKEMHQKQRSLFAKIRKASKETPADDKAAAETVKLCDKLNIELKQIEQKYHDKMLKVLSAQKVYSAINAENRFHRRMMKGWQNAKKKRKDKER